MCADTAFLHLLILSCHSDGANSCHSLNQSFIYSASQSTLHLFIYQSTIQPFIHLSNYWTTPPPLFPPPLPPSLSASISLSLYVCLSLSVSLSLSVCLSIRLSLSLSRLQHWSLLLRDKLLPDKIVLVFKSCSSVLAHINLVFQHLAALSSDQGLAPPRESVYNFTETFDRISFRFAGQSLWNFLPASTKLRICSQMTPCRGRDVKIQSSTNQRASCKAELYKWITSGM